MIRSCLGSKNSAHGVGRWDVKEAPDTKLVSIMTALLRNQWSIRNPGSAPLLSMKNS